MGDQHRNKQMPIKPENQSGSAGAGNHSQFVAVLAKLQQSGVNVTPELLKQIHARMSAAAAPRPMQAPPVTSSNRSMPLPPPQSMPGPSSTSFQPPPPSNAPFAVPTLPAKRKYPPEDANRLVSKRGLDYVMKATGLEDQGFKLDSATEASLMDIYEDFVSNALQFGCSNAKRRPGGASLRPSDIAVYMERTHHITVPGFGNADAREVKPYRKVVATELHKARQRVARETSLEEDRNLAKAKKGVAAGDLLTDQGGKGQAIVSVLGPSAAVPRAAN